jgi:hypothetical protein
MMQTQFTWDSVRWTLGGIALGGLVGFALPSRLVGVRAKKLIFPTFGLAGMYADNRYMTNMCRAKCKALGLTPEDDLPATPQAN